MTCNAGAEASSAEPEALEARSISGCRVQTMPSVNALPVEILDLVLEQVALGYRPPTSLSAWNRALFPQNVAYVCTLWLEILKSRPQYWRQVVIDLASDPEPFLDTLVLFQHDEPIDLLVFSSRKGHLETTDWMVYDEAHKSLEGSRSFVVLTYLTPHIARCRNVAFDLVYQSSLPSPPAILSQRIPFLTELSLQCAVHNLDDAEKSQVGERGPTESPNPFLPSLRTLSLTGYNFLELCAIQPYWLAHPKEVGVSSLPLRINHLTFQDQQTVTTFCSSIEFLPAALALSDVSLNYIPNLENTTKTPELHLQSLLLHSVSSDFIHTFFSTCKFKDDLGLISLTFENCTIPRVPVGGAMGIQSGLIERLQLTNIPLSEKPECSIYNVLEAIPASEILLERCQGVTDDLLDRLSWNNHPWIRTDCISFRDCRNFTSAGLRSFIHDREIQSTRENSRPTSLQLPSVLVVGEGPLLALEDANWSLSSDRKTRISWNVTNVDDDIQDGFIKDLPTQAARRRETALRHHLYIYADR